jgi:hypothetical protein
VVSFRAGGGSTGERETAEGCSEAGVSLTLRRAYCWIVAEMEEGGLLEAEGGSGEMIVSC